MADMTQNPPVDPDAPTEQAVKQTLAALPTWDEWLAQNQFSRKEKPRSAISAVEWNRDFPKFGRGWRLRVAPAFDTINIIVYSNTLSRRVNHTAMVSVSERTVVGLLTKLIAEIERPVSDVTRKRRIQALASAIPYEEREPAVTQEAGPTRRPVPDDPHELNPDQFDQLLNRVQTRCFRKGQRVRVRAARSTRLNGEMGTVVDAGANSCYVALDSYVAAGDPDEFRFEEQELEPVYESTDSADDPAPYMEALDYLTPLEQLGYAVRAGVYTKSLPLGEQMAGCLFIKVYPSAAGVTVYTGCQASNSELDCITETSASALDTVDIIREVEQMAAETQTASEFTRMMQERQFPNAVVAGRTERLCSLFGESMLEAADPDDPQPYFQELQRHAEIINAFRDHGVRLSRRMKADRPYYTLFWIPNVVTDVSYDLYLEPDGTAWTVTAEGHRRFDHEDWGEFDEDFDIARTWTVPAGASGEELEREVDGILLDLARQQGPKEPTLPEPDFDDIGESVDDEIGDYAAYATASAGWNPVRLLTAKQIRQFVREAGFRVKSLYRSRVDHGWTMSASPDTGQAIEVFHRNPYHLSDFMERTAREALKKLMPNLAKIERGMYNLDDKLYVHAWQWSGSTSADPSNPRNWEISLDIRPADYNEYRRGGIKEAAETCATGRRVGEGVDDPAAPVPEPDEVADPMAYATDTLTLDAFMREHHYEQAANERYWYKHIDDYTQFIIWLKPDVNEVALQLFRRSVDAPSEYRYQQSRGTLDGVSYDKLKARLPAWEERVHRADVGFWKQPGVLAQITEGVDAPEEVLAQPHDVYSLNGEYAGYRKVVSFGTFTTLEAAAQRALECRLHEEYDQVWAGCRGNRCRINPDGTTELTHPDARCESEDADDVMTFTKTTLDPREFLTQHGWTPVEHREGNWFKDYPVPRSFSLGALRFNALRVVVALSPSAPVYAQIHWMKQEGGNFPGHIWTLDKQRVYPEAEDESDRSVDANMPVRRFVLGLDRVLASVAWPDTDKVFLANTRLEQVLTSFVVELNDRAATPLYPQGPVERRR